MFQLIGELWCKAVHTQTMWPVNGNYLCAKCLRRYPVAWESKTATPGNRSFALPRPAKDSRSTVKLMPRPVGNPAALFRAHRSQST